MLVLSGVCFDVERVAAAAQTLPMREIEVLFECSLQQRCSLAVAVLVGHAGRFVTKKPSPVNRPGCEATVLVLSKILKICERTETNCTTLTFLSR